MDFLKAFVLAVVEGVTEFLPISSTGHMIIVDEHMKLSQDASFSDAFMVIIQLPAILAVVAYFWKELWPFAKPAEARNATIVLWTKITAAFLPAALFGLLLHDFMKEKLFNPIIVALALVIGGILLLLVERRKLNAAAGDVHGMGYDKALAIGLFQCLAMIPGTSRSAATIIGAMLLGMSRAAAAEFSFFLAIPTMLGAFTVEIAKGGASFTGHQWAILAVGSLVSFLVAYAVVALLMRYIKKHDFRPFGYYRIAFGLMVLAYYFLIGFTVE